VAAAQQGVGEAPSAPDLRPGLSPSAVPPPGAFEPPAAAPPKPVPVADCGTLLQRLSSLMSVYKTAASEAIQNQPLDKAMERARRDALAGKSEGTLVMIGLSSLVHGREGSFPVTTVRQVCTFAERNKQPLHLATCAYFNALNPLGETDAKAKAARKNIARFEALKEPPAEMAEHVRVLKACIPAE
jgi:hypothetical protein